LVTIINENLLIVLCFDYSIKIRILYETAKHFPTFFPEEDALGWIKYLSWHTWYREDRSPSSHALQEQIKLHDSCAN